MRPSNLIRRRISMRPSNLIRRRINWLPNKDRPGLHPVGPYDLWAKVFDAEERLRWLWRWRIIAPLRALVGLPHKFRDPMGWR